MTVEASYQELLRRVRDCRLLGSCSELLAWDERTHMPRKGSAHRAEQLALLARLAHVQFTAPEIGSLLQEVEAAWNSARADRPEAANVREIRRAYDRAVKLPKELVEELARVTTRAQQVWQTARQDDDFASFKPWLEKILRLKQEEAQAIGYRDVPYDALLDEYEPGATTVEIAAVFAGLQAALTPLIAAIMATGRQAPVEILEREYPVAAQEAFGSSVAAAIGFDFDAGRLDVTTHPFCSGMGPGDCRITTRYNLHHFNDAFFGILHEAGHGLYEQGLPPDRFGTPLGSPASLGIHESQSRLWENQVGRSRPFWEYFFPRARELFRPALAGVDLDSFYFAVNDVRPSFIRVEADEATYNLHIILRFELEQSLIGGDLQPADLPAAWRERFGKMFGISPPTDRLGCLQDIHWSMGSFGYFPTYTLGNLYAAQFMEQVRTDLRDLDTEFRMGRFGRLKSWLNDRIYRHGARYRSPELCRQVTGRPLTHQPLIEYLYAKYRPLYEI